MKCRFEYLMIGFLALRVATSSLAGNISVIAEAKSYTYLADASGNYTPAGWLLELGTFASTPTDGSSDLSNFTVFCSGYTGSLGGDFDFGGYYPEDGFTHQQIYLVAFNAASAGAATELGIYYINDADDTNWKFPASTDDPNDTQFDIDNMFVASGTANTSLVPGGHIVFGSVAYDPEGYTQLRLASTSGTPPPPPPDTNFVAVAGSYSGLVSSNVPLPGTTGLLTVKLDENGSFSASLVFGGVRLSFKGAFDDSGDYSTNLMTRLGTTLSITLQAETNAAADQITGTVSDGSFTSDLTANRSTFNAVTNPATEFQGYYTLLFEPGSTNADFPQGNGYGLVSVKAGGKIKLNGKLADGTKITQTGTVSDDGSWPVYIPFIKKQGLLSGWLTFTNIVGVSDLSGTLAWTKPPSARLYPDGFTGTVTAVGALYTKPPAGTPALTVSNSTCNVLFTAGGGNLSTVVSNSLTLNAANKLSACVPDGSQYKIVRASGLFTGNFRNPATGKRTKFKGVLLQRQNLGAGFFIGTNLTGSVTLVPVP